VQSGVKGKFQKGVMRNGMWNQVLRNKENSEEKSRKKENGKEKINEK
jgi:hypothetical protein